MPSHQHLRQTLHRLDGGSYKAYKDIKGAYQFPNFTLYIDYVQGDPFAAPSRVRVRVSQSVAQFPPTLFCSPSRAIALRDYLTRQFDQAAAELSSYRGSGKSGLIEVTRLGQEILDRSAALVNQDWLELRFVVGLPARGRRILGRQAAGLLCEDVTKLVEQALIYNNLNPEPLVQQVETAEDADTLRDQVAEQGLIAFVANGAILPRRSGVDDRPLQDQAIAFQSPPELEVELTCPNRGSVRGMGIRQGITLIVGGGYHGKSTLLRALERGVYNHIPGDGREFVVTDPAAMKIRAEDGRAVTGVDISPFINQLPQGRTTTSFSTPNASGSTSQAANIIEALEAGATVLLVDEDTTATNFMIRDRRMQQLIHKSQEPITPFIDKIQQLKQDYAVSTILVMGGSGDYFEVADTVITLAQFVPADVTAEAHQIAQDYASDRQPEGGKTFGTITPRIPLPQSIDPSRGKRDVKLKVRNVDGMGFGNEEIDLSAVEQLVSPDQLRAIAATLVYAKQHQIINGRRDLPAILNAVMVDLAEEGLDILHSSPHGDMAMFRGLELAAALNRLRSLAVK
ncbi:MAG: ABC-ATPase domain-containing protein [Spirulina sp. SIO3F2]|nr:ABC-ATPase domain-containing protein [Spirulina sp. SIO3F2]